MSIVENYEVLILDLGDVPLVGITAALAIENMVKEAREKHRQIFIVGASGQVKRDCNALRFWEI